MNKPIYNIEDNDLNIEESIVSTPNNFSGEVNIRKNRGTAKYGIFQRDEVTLESILVKHLKADTPPEKIQEAISALKGLEVQDQDTIYDKLRDVGLKTYIELGSNLTFLAAALLPLYTG